MFICGTKCKFTRSLLEVELYRSMNDVGPSYICTFFFGFDATKQSPQSKNVYVGSGIFHNSPFYPVGLCTDGDHVTLLSVSIVHKLGLLVTYSLQILIDLRLRDII